MSLNPPTIYETKYPPGPTYLVSNTTNYTLYIGTTVVGPGESTLVPFWTPELTYLTTNGSAVATVVAGGPGSGTGTGTGSANFSTVRTLLAGANLVVHNLGILSSNAIVSVRNSAGSEVSVRVTNEQANQLVISVAVTVPNAIIVIG